MAPTFATPLTQSTRSEILEWRFPKPYSHLVLTGKSRAMWHTSFIIPQLNVVLDAGLSVNNLRPHHVFLTHGHADHTLFAFVFAMRADPPDMFVPEELKAAFDRYVLATTLMNLGGLVEKDGDAAKGSSNQEEEDEGTAGENAPPELAVTHITHGVRHGDIVALRRSKDITAQVFACDHTVPCVGYVFRTTSYRLRPEIAGLPGNEIGKLRKSGVDVTYPHTAPIFAFLGDTTAKTLADEPDWLREGIPVVITECSFLYEEHGAQADKTKHTIWRDLEPVVRKFAKTTFILTHFSMRYSQKDIKTFFEGLEGGCPDNVVVWIDGQDET